MTSDWALVLLTFVYAIATIWIVVSNSRMAHATRKQVRELQRQFHEQTRPRVNVRIESVRGGLICLVIENTGASPARDVRVSVNEESAAGIPDDLGERLRELMQSVIYLPPQQKLYCTLGAPGDFHRLSESPLLVNVAYSGVDQEYRERADILVSAYGWSLVYDSPLGDISTHVKSIAEDLSRIQRKLA